MSAATNYKTEALRLFGAFLENKDPATFEAAVELAIAAHELERFCEAMAADARKEASRGS